VAQDLSTCTRCQVWFHYERDPAGHDISLNGGVWQLGFSILCPPTVNSIGNLFDLVGNLYPITDCALVNGPGDLSIICAGAVNGYYPTTLPNSTAPDGTPILTGPPLLDYIYSVEQSAPMAQWKNPQIANVFGGLSRQFWLTAGAGNLTTPSPELFPTALAVAEALYATGQTVSFGEQGPADDYALICADQPCPVGFSYDPTTNTCIPFTGLSTTDLTQCCAEVNASLAAVSAAIAANGPVSVVVAPLQTMAANLANILTQLQAIANAGGGGNPIDLTPVVAKLDEINTTLANLPAPDLSSVTTSLNQINNSLDTPKPVATSLDTLAQQGDVPPNIIQYLIQNGMLPPDAGQMLPGSPWTWVVALLSDAWRKLNHPPTADELTAAENDPITGHVVKAVMAGVPVPPLKELLRGVPSAYAKISLDSMDAFAKAAYGTTDTVFEPFIADILALRAKHLSNLGNVKPCDEVAGAVEFIADAMQLGVASHWAAIAGELIPGTKHVGTTQFAAFISEFAGFKDIAKVLLDPELNALIRIPHTYCSNAQARSILPDLHNLNELHARGLIDDATWFNNIPYTGIQDAFAAPLDAMAHRAAQPFALLRGLGLLNVDTTPAVAAMQFGGFRTADIDTLVAAGKRQGLQPLINATVAQFVTLAGEGLMNDTDLTNNLQSLNLTADAINLILQRVHIEQTRGLAKSFKTELDIQALDGQLNLTDYRNALASIGYDPAHVDVFAGVANVRIEKATLAAEARAAAAEARQARQLAVNASMQEYRRGAIEAAQLTAQLIAAGVAPDVAAGYLALASVQRTPTLTVGSKLSDFAQGLADKHALAKAAIEQYKKAIITESVLRSLLASAGYSPSEIDSEVAYLNALAAKKPVA
jgi:hypothetical protein